jgi:uncharacterized membrane protein
MLGKKKKVNRNGLVYRVIHGNRSLGQKAADGLAKWAGSWTFIILFFIFLGIWMATNGIFLLRYIGGTLVDPYPFILLNLVLSCLAAIQAPVILMSQNRQSQKDRTKMEYDYRVNRKAEKNIERILKKLGAIEGGVKKK